jgi:hypothetical protein
VPCIPFAQRAGGYAPRREDYLKTASGLEGTGNAPHPLLGVGGKRYELRHLMAYRLLLITVLLLAFANPAVANWWIVRAADGKCLVVDVEPSGNDVAKVGKDVYQTQQQAESKVKTLCKEDQLPRAPGNAE